MGNSFIHGATTYRVVAPLIVAMLTGGGRAHLHKGALLPQTTRRSQIVALLEMGMIEPSEVAK